MTRAVLALVLCAAVAAAGPRASGRLVDGRLEVTLRGVPAVPVSSIVLGVDGRWRTPAQLVPYEETGDRLAIVVVMQVSRPWIDRESFGIASLIEGALRGFRPPAGSSIAIVTYAGTATLRVPATPFARLPVEPFGTLQEHATATGAEMVAGVELALAQLAKSDAPVKALFVVGDGEDARPEQQPRMRALVERGIAGGVRMHAIVLGDARPSADDLEDDSLEPTAMLGISALAADARFRAILAMLAQHQRIVFGEDTPVADGNRLRLEIGALKIPVELEPAPAARIAFPQRPPIPRAPRVPWLFVGAAVGVMLLLLLLPLLLRRRARPR